MNGAEAPSNYGQVAQACRRLGIAYLAMFGSRARGEEKQESDLDLLVRFHEPKSLITVIGIERELSGLFGCTVDLLTPEAVHPVVRARIEPDLRVLYEE
ncbi:MAG: uncharacterized protein PWP23_2354 [Candidatus Sumerlaeota bacterium]|nr:uncharacterized protein [Candidatus Sumerlaeota bacterium]